jgi:integrase
MLALKAVNGTLVRRPPQRQHNSKVRDREYLTPGEVEKLHQRAKSYGRYGARDALMIWVAYRHGLRVGELVGLRWSQVDFDASALHVKRLKNGNNTASPMDEREIRGLRQLQKTREGQFVFTSERGGPITSAGFRKALARLSAGMFDLGPVHPHMLRHATGYALANRGVETRLIQAILGHREIKHTVGYTAMAPATLMNVWDSKR